VNAIDSCASVLLINERVGVACAYSTFAFHVSEGSPRRVLENHLGDLVVFRDGSVSRIEAIQFLGYWGETFWARVVSFANGGVRWISVTLRAVPDIDIREVCRITVECLNRHPEVIERFFDNEAEVATVVQSVMAASTGSELFDALGVPEPQDALDILA
jgi:hypothetical protein